MSDDRWLSLLSDGADPFAVPPQADPELEIGELEEFDSSKVVFPPDDPLQNYRDSTPLPGLISPSEFTYTTESSEDPPTSEYSSMTHSTSNYLSPIDSSFSNFDLGSEYNGVGLKHNIFPDSSPFFDPFGPQLPPDPFLHAQVVSAQTDDGPYRPSVGISPHSLSTAFQGPPPAYSTDPPVHPTSTTQSRTGPIRKEYICPECGHQSARKHNLKTHMETHNPHRKRPYVCPEGDCGHPFTRKHDLKRHVESMHGDREK